MMAEYAVSCSGQEATFCMNGGTCHKIPTMNSLSCVCRQMYTGSRCETLSLHAHTLPRYNGGVIAATLTVAILIAVAVAVFIYYIIKRLQVRRKEQQDSGQQCHYWKVNPRV